MRLSLRFAEFIKKMLEDGAEGRDIPEEVIQEFSCPTYSMANFMIFTEVYIYDCLNTIKSAKELSPVKKTENN